MDGVTLLKQISELYPHTIRVLLLSIKDKDIAVSAVNESRIYKFIAKPMKRDDIIKTITDSVEQYNVSLAERSILDETFHASMKIILEIFGVSDPVSYSRSNRMYRFVRGISKDMDLHNQWDYNTSALLSQIGCVSLPDTLVQKSIYGFKRLNDEEIKQYKSHAEYAANLLKNVPKLESISEIIRCQFDAPYIDENDFVDDQSSIKKIGTHLLHLSYYYDVERLNNENHKSIIDAMLNDPLQFYTPFVKSLDTTFVGQIGGKRQRVNLEDLVPGMTLAENVRTEKGVLVVAQGLEITQNMIKRIIAFHSSQGIRMPLIVYVAT
ncbi:hypothetical protein BMS3Bbin04_00020 [bacterium BMS3Bbin04]|nr:hypothetical protein BMS3Bbin04_00020 [bacterium BMS3Bbin04]